jgi:hypothetical protein
MSTTQTHLEPDTLDSQVTALLEGLEAAVADGGGSDPAYSGGPARSVDGAAEIDAMAVLHRSQSPAGVHDSIESLDAQLAGLAEDLLKEEGAPAVDLDTFVPAMPAVAAMQPEAFRPKVPAAVPQVAEPPRPAESASPPVVPVASAERKPSELKLWWTIARTCAVESCYKGLQALSAPLDGRPPIVRTAVGVAAAFNLLLAGVVWYCVAVVQPDVAPPPKPVAAKAPAKASSSKAADPGKAKGEKADKGAKKGAKGGH